MELLGHEKKVGEILWHPTAADISCRRVRLHHPRVERQRGRRVMCIEDTDTIYDVWNRNRSLLAPRQDG